MFCRIETATGESKTGEFTVERIPGERLVRASSMIHEGPSHNELLGLPDDTLPQSLSGTLRNLERDKTYEQAVKTASSWKL
jgi:hypothetical protein